MSLIKLNVVNKSLQKGEVDKSLQKSLTDKSLRHSITDLTLFATPISKALIASYATGQFLIIKEFANALTVSQNLVLQSGKSISDIAAFVDDPSLGFSKSFANTSTVADEPAFPFGKVVSNTVLFDDEPAFEFGLSFSNSWGS